MDQSIRRLIACFDGTWNTQKSNTNVSRLFRQIASETTGCKEQRVFYDEGVGTKLGERLLGGAFGVGLDRNIRQGYTWLASQFEVATDGATDASAGPENGFVIGPDVYLFGFSRGAFTARSLGGLINTLGLPKVPRKDEAQGREAQTLEDVVQEAWDLHASRPAADERNAVTKGTANQALENKVSAYDAKVAAFRQQKSRHPVRIHFLGVWDTVGALGIPRVFDNWTFMRPSSKYRFHDTSLGPCVRYAYHAVAIDEQRAPYCVTMWTWRHQTTTLEVEQRWFPGAHADVGGGYEDTLLPDPPLAWIATKAIQRGLQFIGSDATTRLPAPFALDGSECLTPLHDSYAEFIGGTYRVLRALPGAGGRAYRRMLVDGDGIHQIVDDTANRRLAADADYRPPNLAQAGRCDVTFNRATPT